MTDIPAKVREIVADILNSGCVTDATSFDDEFGVDSLDRLEILMKIEVEFDVNIPDRDADGIDAVADLIAYVEKAKGAA